MRKTTKSLLLICVFIISMSLNAMAAADTKTDDKVGVEVSDKLIEICENFFETSTGEYRAIDKTGNDVTNEFYNQYKAAYDNREYEVLSDAIADELMCIKWRDVQQVGMARSSLIPVTVRDEFYALGQTKKLLNGKKTFEMVYSIKGTFQFVSNTGEIRSYSNPTFNMEWFSAGAAFDYQLHNLSTNAVKRGSNRVDFSAKFYINLSGNYEGVSIGYEIVGPFSGIVSGYGEVI